VERCTKATVGGTKDRCGIFFDGERGFIYFRCMKRGGVVFEGLSGRAVDATLSIG